MVQVKATPSADCRVGDRIGRVGNSNVAASICMTFIHHVLVVVVVVVVYLHENNQFSNRYEYNGKICNIIYLHHVGREIQQTKKQK